MAQTQEDLSKIYGGVFVTDPTRAISVNPDIRYGLPEIREAFNRAARGEQAVSNDLANKLVNGETVLYRSNPADQTEYDFKADIEPLAAAIGRNILTGRPPGQGLDRQVKQLSERTGLDEGHIRARIDEYFRENGQELEKKFLPEMEKKFFFTDAPDNTARAIITLVEKQVRTGGLSEEETARLGESKAAWAREQNWAPSLVDETVQAMETYIRSGEHYTKEFSENLNVEIGDTRTTHGTAYTASHIAVPRYDPATASKHVAFGFAPDDVPGHPVPATIEQIEFLAALHEAEHTMLERKPVIADKNSPVRQQAWEIDADSAVVQPSTILKTRRSRNIGCRPETSSRFRPGLRDVS